jgi:hypothetical protein
MGKKKKGNIGGIQRGHENQETPAECMKSGLVGRGYKDKERSGHE